MLTGTLVVRFIEAGMRRIPHKVGVFQEDYPYVLIFLPRCRKG
ncbi:MAG: hypothetical protein PHP23_03755 [Desulfobacterales bacterium]|nr:hypothetical protein [Desulfobacterales bacterium]MDD4071881.1 hypothetical protein [Desulfobacterales bacterium]MDD4392490.1 hypothetical protein [Desulfobacterales bacterium]